MKPRGPWTPKTKPVIARLPVVTYRARRPGKVYLDMNEPIFEKDEDEMVKALVSCGSMTLRESLHHYPVSSDLDVALRERVERHLGCDAGTMITRGSDAALRIVFEAFAFEGMRVGVLDPTYDSVLGMLARSGGVHVSRLPCESALDFSEVLDCDGEPFDVIYFCNPNNPFGYAIKRSDVLKAVDARPETLFVVDEAYVDHVVDAASVTVASECRLRNNLIVTRSFSKSYGIPGARLGVVISSAETLDVLARFACPTEVPDTSKAIGLACLLPEHLAVFREYFLRVRRLRETFMERLRSMKSPGYVGILCEEGIAAGLFATIELANEGIANGLTKYLNVECDLVVARKTFEDRSGKPRHLVRCTIGTAETTELMCAGILSFFSLGPHVGFAKNITLMHDDSEEHGVVRVRQEGGGRQVPRENEHLQIRMDRSRVQETGRGVQGRGAEGRE